MKTGRTLSEQLRGAIAASGKSNYSICKEAGVSQAAMSRFMAGKGGWSLASLDKLVASLQIEWAPARDEPPVERSRQAKLLSARKRAMEGASGNGRRTRPSPGPALPFGEPIGTPTLQEGHCHVVAGLFAGVGGIELGLGRSAHKAALLCEIEDSAHAVLKGRFPSVRMHRDIRQSFDLPSRTSLLTAGFPCQDLSQAGQTRGIKGARSGLVGEVFKLLREHEIPWVLLENVPFMLQLARGEALELIVSALEELGYRWAYRVVDSRAFGLPQRRRRVYMLAARLEDPRTVLFADDVGEQPEPSKKGWRSQACGFYWTEGLRGLGWAFDAVPTLKGGSTIGIPSPPAIVLRSGEIVTPDIRDAERLQGFDAGWTDRVEKLGGRWKLVGNAVSVDSAGWIGRRMRTPGTYDDSGDAPLVRGSSWPTAAWNVDGRRMVSGVSEWPEKRKRPHLEEFLKYAPKPLSAKAARGFHSRALQAKLEFPPGFLDVVRRHYERQEKRG